MATVIKLTGSTPLSHLLRNSAFRGADAPVVYVVGECNGSLSETAEGRPAWATQKGSAEDYYKIAHLGRTHGKYAGDAREFDAWSGRGDVNAIMHAHDVPGAFVVATANGPVNLIELCMEEPGMPQNPTVEDLIEKSSYNRVLDLMARNARRRAGQTARHHNLALKKASLDWNRGNRTAEFVAPKNHRKYNVRASLLGGLSEDDNVVMTNVLRRSVDGTHYEYHAGTVALKSPSTDTLFPVIRAIDKDVLIPRGESHVGRMQYVKGSAHGTSLHCLTSEEAQSKHARSMACLVKSV